MASLAVVVSGAERGFGDVMNDNFGIHQHTEVRRALEDYGFPPANIFLPDAEYVCPTPESIVDFGANLKNLLWQLGMTYREESFDCDDFSKVALGLLILSHRKFFKFSYALAAGVASGFTDTSGHAVIACVHDNDDGKLSVALYEPQPTPLCLQPYPKFAQPYWCYL